MDIKILLFVGGVTFFFSFLMQVIFYWWYKSKDSKFLSHHKTVFDYTSGVIGDGILIPLTNIFAFFALNQINIKTDFSLWIVSLAGGFALTLGIHFGQKQLGLTNWTMPEVGKWNTLGITHAMFMFCETSFLLYAFSVFIKKAILLGPHVLLDYPIKYAFITLLMFLLTFTYDYKGVKILRKLPLPLLKS